jgi:hypothetical protein
MLLLLPLLQPPETVLVPMLELVLAMVTTSRPSLVTWVVHLLLSSTLAAHVHSLSTATPSRLPPRPSSEAVLFRTTHVPMPSTPRPLSFQVVLETAISKSRSVRLQHQVQQEGGRGSFKCLYGLEDENSIVTTRKGRVL